ncbi:hypothetical protein PQR15_03060 [Streptomyces lydicus]|nr:hypothetical protein [Streptomyces lydicus]
MGEVTVEAVFEMSYAQLPSRHAQAFLALSVPHCAEFDVRAAAAALRMPEREVEDVLEALVDAALLETGSPGCYHFHDLVGAYARQKARAELPAPSTARWCAARSTSCAPEWSRPYGPPSR